jgi:hypothetical protein
MTDTDSHAEALVALLRKWEKPPADMVGKLPRKGPSGGTIHLDYLGHAAVTRILTEADPLWSWEPVAWDEDGTPLIRQQGKRLILWGRLTVLGKTVLCCGTCDSSKWEPEKELIGDLLRNGAMRFGVALSLWAKEEWQSLDGAPPEVETRPSPVETRSGPRRADRRGPEATPVRPDPESEPTAGADRPDPEATSGATRAKALKRARELAEAEGIAPPSTFDDLAASDLWPTVAADLGLAS